MLEIANLEVVYNEVILVLRGLSIQVPDGHIVALLGANGAGKTTTTRAITGLLDLHEGKVTKGSVTFQGRQINGDDPSAIVRSGITQVMEGRRVFAELTVDENLATGGITNKNRKALATSYDRVMTMFPLLAERRSATAGYLSGGEQQMLAVARAVMTRPKLLLVDEPSLGLAPKIVDQIYEILLELRKTEGLTLVINEQSSNRVLKFADRISVLRQGEIRLTGTAAELADGAAIRQAYFGFEHGAQPALQTQGGVA